ncbi:hypothetical protein [Streptomyces sp. NPDC050848]|uniref:hypothetical protein n=1 Tax=Streptomyces sp. NPDC050848 TaxID=3155791 RepID=UPI0033C0AC6F
MSPSGTFPTTLTPFDADEALRRARTDRVVRPARRTLAEMAPGYQRQPLLRLVPHVAFDQPCIVCEKWLCPGNCQQFASAPAAAMFVKAVA